MSSHHFLQHGRSQETGPRHWLISLSMRFRVNEMVMNTQLMDLFGWRYIFKFVLCLLLARLINLSIRIKILGEAPLAIQQVMSMSIALTRTIPIQSVAVVFNWIAMVLIPASVLTKAFSKTASALSQTQKRCNSYGITSLMRILVKLAKQKILFTGMRPILYSLDSQFKPTLGFILAYWIFDVRFPVRENL